MKKHILQTVVETPEFLKQANSFMDDISKEDFISYIAGNPYDGDIITGTGGVRKIRWASNINQCKRGGARIIYYFYDKATPIFLFTAYGKNHKTDLTMAEKNMLAKVVRTLIATYRGNDDE